MKWILAFWLAAICGFGQVNPAAIEALERGRNEVGNVATVEAAVYDLQTAIDLFDVAAGTRPSAYGEAIDLLGIAQFSRRAMTMEERQNAAFALFQRAADFSTVNRTRIRCYTRRRWTCWR